MSPLEVWLERKKSDLMMHSMSYLHADVLQAISVIEKWKETLEDSASDHLSPHSFKALAALAIDPDKL